MSFSASASDIGTDIDVSPETTRLSQGFRLVPSQFCGHNLARFMAGVLPGLRLVPCLLCGQCFAFTRLVPLLGCS